MLKVRVVKEIEERAGYQLGLVFGRQSRTRYTWQKVVVLARKESAAQSSNALRLSINVFGWGYHGRIDDRYSQRFAGDDSKAAIAYAKNLIAEGLLHSAWVVGEAGRLFAQSGYGDKATFTLARLDLEG